MTRTTRFGFLLLWGAVAAGAFALSYFWTTGADFVGVVENRTHKLGAPEGGRVRQVLVRLGDEVDANQLLAVLDLSDLEHERDWLTAELAGLEAALEADRARYGLEYARLRLQGRSSEAGIRERRAELESRRGELSALNTQIERLEAAQRAGLGRSRDLDDLVVRRDMTARFLREAGPTLRSEAVAQSRDGAPAAAPRPEDVVRSMMGERLERISDLKLQLEIVQDRMERRKLYSPCRGHVVKIDAIPGDVVDEYLPILNVEEPAVAFLDVYIPETSDFQPRLGQRVRVLPHRSGAANTRGTVVFIDPGYAAVPDRLAYRGIVYWARKFRVRLDDGHRLMPGEAAKVEVLDEFLEVPANGRAEAAARVPQAIPVARDDGTAAGPAPRPMVVPAGLRARSGFEPSGLAWLPDLDRYLVASDDTGRTGEAAHAPWLFLADRDGRVEPEPLVVQGAAALNDIEAIATRPDGTLYLVSSQGLSRRGKRPDSRRQVLQVERTGRNLRVTGSVDFVDVLSRSLDAEGRAALGLGAGDVDLAGLEIEGAAFLLGDLLLALKGPRPDDGALLWRMKDPAGLLERNTLRHGQLSLLARVDLRTRDGRPAAFADLAADAHGALWATSTVPDAPAASQEGGLHRLGPALGGVAQATRVRTFPGLKPEGLCTAGDGGLAVVFDSDDQPPFLFLKVEGL